LSSFFLEIKNPKQTPQIDFKSHVFLMGSCFGENISSKLDYYKFSCLSNPLGIVFHPMAITTLLIRIISRKSFTREDFFYHQERWHCYEVHSKFSNPCLDQMILDLNIRLEKSYHFLKQTSHLILTLGTAYGYEHFDTKKIVANCHKMPQKHFEKKLSTISSISQILGKLLRTIQDFNPDITVLLTLSPIRHIKDGIIENNRSKAHLLAAIHQSIESQNSDKVTYFHSYEILLDTLREYRFYTPDLLHPNAVAIDYIWEQFKASWIAKDLENVLQRIDKIQKSIAHKPFYPNSNSHQLFLEKLQEKIQDLYYEYPNMQKF